MYFFVNWYLLIWTKYKLNKPYASTQTYYSFQEKGLSSMKLEASNNRVFAQSPCSQTNNILSHTYEAPHEDLWVASFVYLLHPLHLKVLISLVKPRFYSSVHFVSSFFSDITIKTNKSTLAIQSSHSQANIRYTMKLYTITMKCRNLLKDQFVD